MSVKLNIQPCCLQELLPVMFCVLTFMNKFEDVPFTAKSNITRSDQSQSEIVCQACAKIL